MKVFKYILVLSLLSSHAKAQFYFSDSLGNALINDTIVFCDSDFSFQLHLNTSGTQSNANWTVSSSNASLSVDSTSLFGTLNWTSSNGQIPQVFSVSVTDSILAVNSTVFFNVIPLPVVETGQPDTTIAPCSSGFQLPVGSPSSGFYMLPDISGNVPIDSINPEVLNNGSNNLVYAFSDSLGCMNYDTSSITMTAHAFGSIIGFETYGGQNDTIFPISYNGIPTYSICSSVSSPTFTIQLTGAYLNYSTFSIDWGNGNTSNGGISSLPVSQQYNSANLYQIQIQLEDSNGCVLTDTIAFYYGTTQPLGLGTPGNTTTCFESGIDSIYYDFQILYWELDPVGITYQFSSNDGSVIQTAISPLVSNGTSNYPFLVYDSISGILFYRHWFTSSSCGYTTELGGISYDNVFSVSAIKQAPCNGSQSTVAVGPILVSRSPSPGLSAEEKICLNEFTTIDDTSSVGTLISSNLSNFSCDDSKVGVWFVQDINGVSLQPSTTTYTLASGSALGDTNSSASYPSLWSYGSTNLTLAFHQTGMFQITKIIGLSNTGSSSTCETGGGSIWICVDSIPEVGLITGLDDTICSYTDYEIEFESAISFCGDSLLHRVIILDSLALDTIFISSLTKNGKINVSTSLLGSQIIKYQTISPCGKWELMDTIDTYNNPRPDFFNDTVLVCDDSSLNVSIGFGNFEFDKLINNYLYDSITYSIFPYNGWLETGQNSIGLPEFTFNSNGYYSIQIFFYGECRIDTASIALKYGPIPDAYFRIDTLTSCDFLYLEVDSLAQQLGAHQWILTIGSSTINKQGSNPDFDTVSSIDHDSLIVSHFLENEFGCIDSFQTVVYLPEKIQSNMFAPRTICSDDSILILNMSTGNVTSYEWELIQLSGDSTNLLINQTFDSIPDLTIQPFYLPNNTQTYTLSLEVQDSRGCVSNAIDTLSIIPRPNNPNYTLANDTICAYESISISGVQNFGGIHNWYLFDSTGSIISQFEDVVLDSIENSYFSFGNHTLVHEIRVLDSLYCDTSYSIHFFIAPQTDILITSPLATCEMDSILVYAESSTSDIPYWSWMVNDSIVSTDSTLQYFAQSGTFQFSLEARDEFDCVYYKDDSIQVYSIITAQYELSSSCGIDTVCLNEPIGFSFIIDTTLNVSDSIFIGWDFNNDGIFDRDGDSASYTFTSPGIQNVNLHSSNEFSCEADTTFSVVVIEKPIVQISFSDHSFCGSYSPIIIDTIVGLYDSAYYEIYTKNSNGNIQLHTVIGYNETLNFPVFNPAQNRDTTYYISLTAWNCCGVTSSIDSITLNPLPVAELIPIQDTGCSPFTCVFPLDGYLFGNIDSAYLHFGDGQGSSLHKVGVPVGNTFDSVWQQASHVYNYQGPSDTIYFATLHAFNQCGDTSFTVPINVQRGSVVSIFNASKVTGCAPLTVDFQNLSYNYKTLSWCFDYNLSTGQCDTSLVVAENPTWTFETPGIYTVGLFLTANCGLDSSFLNIEVLPSPESNFVAPSAYCGNDTIIFQNTSHFTNGVINGYLWEFGDGDSSYLINPAHVYDTSGTYQVILTSFGSNGCNSKDSLEIQILPTPNVQVSGSSVCLGDTTFFINNTTINSGQIIGQYWDFGDGNTSNSLEPFHIYNQPGIYEVILTSISNSGCQDSSITYVNVAPLPLPSFTFSDISIDSCSLPRSFQFINQSQNAFSFTWNFDLGGSNTSSTMNNPQHTYSNPGVYVVQLYVENQFGCWDTITETIEISEGIEAVLSSSVLEGCAPLSVTFSDFSIVPLIDSIQSVEFIFGDGSKKIITSPPYTTNHLYQLPGNYSAYAIVHSIKGCSYISPYKFITVYDIPSPDFTYQNDSNQVLHLFNQSIPIDSSYIYNWTMSTGQFSNKLNPSFVLPSINFNYDSVTICLKVESIYGCTNEECKQLWIWNSSLYVPNAFAPELNYIGEDNLFLPKGHNLGQYELWIYDKWGNEVFHTDDLNMPYSSPAIGWNGKYMGTGKDLPMGVYSWRIFAVFKDGKRWIGQKNSYGEIKTYGTLTLLR